MTAPAPILSPRACRAACSPRDTAARPVTLVPGRVHLPGGAAAARRPAFSLPLAACPTLGARRASPAMAARRAGILRSQGDRHVSAPLRPLGHTSLPRRFGLGRSPALAASDGPVFGACREVTASLDLGGRGQEARSKDPGPKAGAAPWARLTISTGWETSDAGRDGGFAQSSLLDCPGGDAAAGAFSSPLSALGPCGSRAERGGSFLVNRPAYRGQSAGADALSLLRMVIR